MFSFTLSRSDKQKTNVMVDYFDSTLFHDIDRQFSETCGHIIDKHFSKRPVRDILYSSKMIEDSSRSFFNPFVIRDILCYILYFILQNTKSGPFQGERL